MVLQQLFFPAAILPRLEHGGQLDAAAALDLLRERAVRFLSLQTCDIFGRPRSLEVPASRFEEALRGEVMFDGSALDGRARVDEAEMRLCPDLSTLRLVPWEGPAEAGAQVICDVQRPDGSPFEADPRGALRRALAELDGHGYEARVGVELEFFLFQTGPDGEPTPRPSDRGGYYGLGPTEGGAPVRRDVVNVLEALGVAVEATQHDVAPGQHRVMLAPAAPLVAADQVLVAKLAIRQVAARHGLHASFMPKPLTSANGAGMHLHQLLLRDGQNLFDDPEERDGLSAVLRWYVGGLLRHARGYSAVACPLVNSYKRLVPGFEAPVGASWSLNNRSPMVRIPTARGEQTRCEHRLPDAAANPYLTLAVQLASGLDGIVGETHPGDPVGKSLEVMSPRERARLKIEQLPRHLGEALDALEQDRVVRSALGEYIFGHFVRAKRAEWDEYLSRVHPWELERYLAD